MEVLRLEHVMVMLRLNSVVMLLRLDHVMVVLVMLSLDPVLLVVLRLIHVVLLRLLHVVVVLSALQRDVATRLLLVARSEVAARTQGSTGGGGGRWCRVSPTPVRCSPPRVASLGHPQGLRLVYCRHVRDCCHDGAPRHHRGQRKRRREEE